MPVVMPDALKSFARRILIAAGVMESDAEVVADCVVKAELRGVESHGVSWIPLYVKRFQKGLINSGVRIRIVKEAASVALVDGCNGWGPVVSSQAMELAMEKARNSGVGVVSVRNDNHGGMLAYYTMKALRHDMVGMMASNGASTFVAPWQGREARFATNPFSIAIPAGRERPIVLDMASTVVAAGKILAKLRRGEKIPEGWALDERGKPTIDPYTAFYKGTLIPFGGPKGYAIAVVIEVLSGILSGEAFPCRSNFDLTAPSTHADFMLALDISKFESIDEFKERMDRFIRWVKSTSPADGYNEVLIPGEPEFRVEEERLKKGIPVDEPVWKELRELASQLGISI